MTTRLRYLIISLALAAPVAASAAWADRATDPPASDATQTRKDDGKKTGDTAVTRGSGTESRQTPQARSRDDKDQKGQATERRNPDRSGDRSDQRGAERRNPPTRPPGTHVLERSHVVFVGGYFYDPFFGEYPWWSPVLYPHPRILFDRRAEVRLQVTPRAAAVYVDGFYAGVVDDFDGFFERLPLLPGGHTLAFYLNGFATVTRSIYLAPGSELRIREVLAPLPPGVPSEPPAMAALLPAPPPGTFIPPRTAPLGLPQPPSAAEQVAGTTAAGFGILAIRFRPSDAVVVIDGQEWATSAAGELLVHVAAGGHLVQLRQNGRQIFSTEVQVREGETTDLNVSAPSPTD